MLVIVEHFLNEEGKLFFPSWFEKAKAALVTYQGFQWAELLEDIEVPGRTLILFRFASQDDLKIWANSSDHLQLLEILKPFMLQKQESKLYKII